MKVSYLIARVFAIIAVLVCFLPCNALGQQSWGLQIPVATTAPAQAAIQVSWNSIPGAGRYKVKRVGFFHQEAIVYEGPNTSFIDTNGIQNGIQTDYRYTVTAEETVAPFRSSISAPVGGYTYVGRPAGLTISKSGANFILSWGEAFWATNYRVYRSINGQGFFVELETTATSVNLGPLTTSENLFRVVGFNNAGEGPPTHIISTFGHVTSGEDVPWYPCSPQTPGCRTLSPVAGGLAKSSNAGGTGPSAGDPVNLATGEEEYLPETGLITYNPNGPVASFQIGYSSALAKQFRGSPGLPVGWSHTYDVSITVPPQTEWSPITLNFPNGSQETATPILASGVPTGQFSISGARPYRITGVAGTIANTWSSISIAWQDQTTWVFEADSDISLSLKRIVNSLGHGVVLNRNSSRAVTEIRDFASSALLQSISYSAGLIDHVTDTYGRRIYYDIAIADSPEGAVAIHALVGQSQIVASTTSRSASPRLLTIDYIGHSSLAGVPLISTISKPSPSGTGTATAFVNWGVLPTTGNVGVTSLVDGNFNKQVFTYQANQTIVSYQDPLGNAVLSYTERFDSLKRQIGSLDASGFGSTLFYTDPNHPTKVTQVLDAKGRSEYFTYDSIGNLISHTDRRGVVTTFVYSYAAYAFGRLVSTQEGSKPATTFTYYEPSGLLQSVSSPRPGGGANVVTSFTYDSIGNITSVTTPGNNSASSLTTTLNYTSDGTYSQPARAGQALTATSPDGRVSRARYDSEGQPIWRQDPSGHEYDFSYNIAGQPLMVQLPETGSQGTGRVTETTEYLYTGGPAITSRLFDESGSQIRTSYRSYDNEGQVVATSGSTDLTTYVYDAADRLVAFSDGLGQTTTYTYNTRGFQSSVQRPGGATQTFNSYDETGNVTSITDELGRITQFGYVDPDDRPTAITFVGDSSQNSTRSYDSFGRLTSEIDSSGTRSYTYGHLDELLTETTTYTGLPARVLTHSYFPDGSRSGLATPAGSFSYSYDSAGRLTSLTNPYAETSSWDYDWNSLITKQTLANGSYTETTFNEQGLPTLLDIRRNTTALIGRFNNLTYDGVTNPKTMGVWLSGQTNYGGTHTWNYDSKDRLTSESTNRLGGWSHSFGYDNAGNLTTFKGAAKSYNSRNQRTGSGFAYSLTGEATTWKGISATYDRSGNLTSYGSLLTAGYRSDGLRAWKQDAAGLRTYYVYDGTTPILELTAAGGVRAVNTFGADGLVSRRASGASTFYTFDARGATAQRLSSTQSILTTHASDAYGSVTSTVSVSDPWIGIGAKHGYYRDWETGLYLCTYRYYDPAEGLWLTEDPIGFAGGPNLYAYVSGGPIGSVDPLGLERDFLYTISDFVAGFGDSATFGATRWIRQQMGSDSVVDTWSRAYMAGEVANMVVEMAGGSPTGAIKMIGKLGIKGGKAVVGGVVACSAKLSAKAAAKSSAKVAEEIPGGVYQLVDEFRMPRYFGSTNNLKRREKQHAAFIQEHDLVFVVFQRVSSEREWLVIEQRQIEIYKMKKDGGTLLNQRNAISPKNPRYKDVHK